MINKALRISFDAHKNQVDKSDIPYVYHPFHLAEQMDDEKSVIVALLHDVVEDSDYTIEDLKDVGFDKDILDAISLLTHKRYVPYMEYIKKIKPNPLAKKVKIADLKHNSDISRNEIIDIKSQKRFKKYREALAILEEEDKKPC